MNSALKSKPDGDFYACSECTRVYAGHGNNRVANSKALADRCCLCARCHLPVSTLYQGSVGQLCQGCYDKRRKGS